MRYHSIRCHRQSNSALRQRLKSLRVELKLTQREFGEMANIDRRYIAKVECGSQTPSFKFLRNVAVCHKISLDWLLFGVGDMFIKFGDKSYGNDLVKFRKLLDTATDEDIDVIMKMMDKMIGQPAVPGEQA